MPRGVLRAVTRRANVQCCTYLDDWQLWGTAEDLDHATAIIRALGVTINEAKSTLIPTKQLTYLGFRVNSDRLTIKMLLATHDRLRFLLRHTRKGSEKDRERIHGFTSWVLYNLRLPLFLGRDILRGDSSWLDAALLDLRVLEEKELCDPPLQLNLYTDATPHSIAAIITTMDISYAQEPEEINRAEMIVAIRGLVWAAEQVRETNLILHVDNAAVFSNLRTGTGRTFRHHDVRRLYLSMLHSL